MLLGGDSLIYSGSNGNAPQDTAAFVQAARQTAAPPKRA